MNETAPAIIAVICLFTGGLIWLLLRYVGRDDDDQGQPPFRAVGRSRSTSPRHRWFYDQCQAADVRDRVLMAHYRKGSVGPPVNITIVVSDAEDFKRGGVIPGPKKCLVMPGDIIRPLRRTPSGRLTTMTLLAVFALALFTSCGAREHRDNLAEVVKLQAQRDALIAEQERQRKEALAQMALELREQRREIQDARRTIEQVTQEMEASD